MKPKTRSSKTSVRINRKIPQPALIQFTAHFQGFEKVGAVRNVFGDQTNEVLGKLRISFFPNRQMFMGIRDNDGNLAVGTYHLRNSPTRTLYLDVVHELFHVKQWMDDKGYFTREHMKFMQNRSLYYASPIEIPAYEHTVREAERIGMSSEEIVEYLKMGEAPPKTWRQFLKEMDLKKEQPTAKRVTRFPVKIMRKTTPKTNPFLEYFEGFEKVPAVKALLGDSTNDFLSGLAVEFIDSPWPVIYPSEEDGHLIVAARLMREGSVESIYLEVLLGISVIKATTGARVVGRSPDEIWRSPSMVQAYSGMVKEARRLGLPDGEIERHLTLPGFLMSGGAYDMFLKSVGLGPRRVGTSGISN